MSTISQRSHLTDSEAWRVVGRIWNRFLETGSAGRRPGQDRRRATTSNEDRCLVLTARRHRNKNAIHLQRHLRSATGTTISTQTVRDWTHGVGLYARRSMVCIILTSRLHRDRREWATEHVNWRRNEWSNVLFSNESRFSVHPNKIGVFSSGGSVAVGILLAIGDDFILMDNNCRPPDRANLVEDFLFEEGIVRMEWPACSPDMNPIQHVWDALGRRVAGRQPYPQTLQELEKALLEEWDRIPQLVINRLIDSMSQRVWKEHCFPSNWREPIVIPILKPGKVTTDPLSYRPIALTSCFCKTFERRVNSRLVYVLEKEKCISPLQSGFRKGRSTLDNLVFLESQIRNAFVRRNHLVSLFLDIEKAYDRTWRISSTNPPHLDYGCVVYGSARASVLKRLDTSFCWTHHSALRICSGAFRTSPVTSLYVVCHQPPLELRRRQLSANYFIRAMSVPSHPLKPFSLAIGLTRLYEARSFNIKPFSERAKAILNDAHLNNIKIQENNILAFPPWTSKFVTIVTPFRAMTKQALLLLFISNSFLTIAVSILNTYQSTRTD
ncbi:probable RNA-directed DNA polymerase from transposon X-element [Trichonephila clavipes]|nr:probable RNA-directed DNA polymerase from transposon X-element [Trichonephila clavipes]